jgi:two-component system CheB/CheR fusion protein
MGPGSARELLVAIGVSCDGIGALDRLLAEVPARSGLGFVVVPRLDASNVAELAERLARHSALPVVRLADGDRPSAEHVYVAPSDAVLTLEQGAFRLATATDAESRLVDALFQTLAEGWGERAVGILLGDDLGREGSAGLRAIQDRGGMALTVSAGTLGAQASPPVVSSAPPEDLAHRLLAHARHLAQLVDGARESEEAVRDRLTEICAAVHQQTGHDFGDYKEGTLLRRVRRRMQALHLCAADDYLHWLRGNADEAAALVKELLIGVTQFFRDPEAFDALARQVLPELVQGGAAGAPLRIWVPGCASGEEAYSIAILVLEALEQAGSRRKAKVFATDLDAEQVAQGRLGRYSAEACASLSPERLARFFVRDGDGFQAGSPLRELCLFAQHSLTRDPPFSQIDLVSCRNVLIYLNAELHRKLGLLFHYALRPGGFLFLGPSEGAFSGADLFEPIDKKSRIFRRKEPVARALAELPSVNGGPPDRHAASAAPPDTIAPRKATTGRARLAEIFQRTVLEEYAAPCAVVDERGELAFQAGPLARYLRLPSGAPSTNLLEMIPGSLRLELRLSIQAAAERGRRVVRDCALDAADDGTRQLRLVVRPMPVPDALGKLFLVVFQERSQGGVEPSDEAPDPVQFELPAVQELENELRSTRAELEATVQQLESSNEELKSSNEELVSMNEELQSANEEMETSREELQGVNAELETANARLEQKVGELATANGELQALNSELERTDQALRESEERLRIFVEYAPAPLAMFDREMRYLSASRRWRLDYELEQEDLRGLSLYEVFPGLGEDWRAAHRRGLAGEVVRCDRDRFVRADGTIYWLRWEVRPWRDGAGGVGGIVIFSEDITAIVAAGEEARQSAELLRLAQEAAQVGTWFWDTRTGEKYWSDELWTLFGLEKGGRSVGDELLAEVVLPEDLEPARSAMVAALIEGKDLKIEYRVRRDGEVRHLLARGKALRDAGGAVARVLGITIDITDQKRSELELRLLFEQRQLALDAAQMGWQCYDAATERMRFDGRFGEILGLSGRECGWAEIIQVMHPDDVARVEVEVRKALDPENPRPYSVEHRVVRPGGTIRWVEAHGQAVFEEGAGGRRLTGYVGTAADITDRKETQQWAERTNRGLGRLAGASLAVMAETALEPMLRVVAEAALALTGAKGAVCAHGFAAGQFTHVGAARAKGIPTYPDGEMLQLQNGGVDLVLCADAESIRLTDAELRKHPRWWGLPSGHSEVRGLLGIRMAGPKGVTSGVILVTDKERGDFTDEDEALIKQLGLVASLALHHVEARISLEEADRRKNEFLAMLSHELRNPLAPIRNSLYVLERAAPGGEQARRAQVVIDRQVAHMTRLVDDLLDVTRISRGKIQLRREPLELGENVRRVVEDHRSAFTARGIELEVSIPEEPLPVEGDRTRVAQVIGNLLNNAAKFTPKGGQVRVLVDRDPATSQARVRVRDTGAGIAPEMMPRLFEPFTQADATLDRSQGGLGLGLALVKGLVELHGGTVAAASDGPGLGTEFTIQIPLRRGAAQALGGPGRPESGTPATRRVLVIEDNVDAAASLQEVLELGSHAVSVAHTGPEGLEKARAFDPDIVFCDIGLPGMDGYQIARSIRADPELKSLVLVALTGYAGPEDVSRSREAGFDYHLAKPASLERLEQIVAGGAGAGARLSPEQ